MRLPRPQSLDRTQLRYLARRVYLGGRRALTGPVERRLGVETAAPVDLEDLGVAHPDRARYEPSSVLSVLRGLRAVEGGRDDVFLDYGSGKGRVLLAAARRPFARVVGVEIAPELCEAARANLAADARHRRCGAVEVVCADVTTWDVPDDVTVAFMYNPIAGDAFDAAVDRLLASIDRRPRRVRLVYNVPIEEQRLLATGRVRVVRSLPGLRPGRAWSQKMGVRVYELA